MPSCGNFALSLERRTVDVTSSLRRLGRTVRPRMPTAEDSTRRTPHGSPPPIDDIVGAFAATPGEPQTGQIWRARWATSVQLVFVHDITDDSVDAVPVTPDVAVAGGIGVVLDKGRTPLGFDAVAWTPLRRRLPVRVLEVVFGSADDETTERVAGDAGESEPLSVLDERAQVVDAIAERMDALAGARWVPDVTELVDIAAVMRERNLGPGRVAGLVDVDPGEITEIIRGDRTPNRALADKLAPVLGIDAATLTGPRTVDPDLVRVLDQPRFRRRLAERGREAGVVDEAQWRYQVATGELPVAARTTGHADNYRRWLGLVEDYLR